MNTTVYLKEQFCFNFCSKGLERGEEVQFRLQELPPLLLLLIRPRRGIYFIDLYLFNYLFIFYLSGRAQSASPRKQQPLLFHRLSRGSAERLLSTASKLIVATVSREVLRLHGNKTFICSFFRKSLH